MTPGLDSAIVAVRLLIVEDSALIRSVTHLAFPPTVHQLVEAEIDRMRRPRLLSDQNTAKPVRHDRPVRC